jgi:hypothetical protein
MDQSCTALFEVHAVLEPGAADTRRKQVYVGALIESVVVFFEICGDITGIETFAVGTSIRELPRLRKMYGRGRWRKRKGVASIKLATGKLRKAELHWYEISGIGRKK